MNESRRELCVLVVDDERSVTDVIRRALRRRGDVVLAAHSAAEAWAALTEAGEAVNRALIDVSLNDEDGFALALEIHAAYPNIRIFLMTGGHRPLGAEFGYIRKPFDLEELWAAVA